MFTYSLWPPYDVLSWAQGLSLGVQSFPFEFFVVVKNIAVKLTPKTPNLEPYIAVQVSFSHFVPCQAASVVVEAQAGADFSELGK